MNGALQPGHGKRPAWSLERPMGVSKYQDSRWALTPHTFNYSKWRIETDMMGILRPLTKGENSNHFVMMMTERFAKLTEAINTSKTTVWPILSHFMHDCIIPYGISTHISEYNWTQLVSKFIRMFCYALSWERNPSWLRHTICRQINEHNDLKWR